MQFQIFESNTVPQTYAFNITFSGSRVPSTNTIIVAIGSNWPTVFRAFKLAFKEKTGVEWDKRVAAANKRSEQEVSQKRQAQLARQARQANQRVDPTFATQPTLVDYGRNDANFQYNPPAYGPKGEFGNGSHIKLVEHSSQAGNGEISSPNAVKPDFEPKDAEKFQATINAEDPEDKIDPFSDPFSFGPEQSHFDDAFHGSDVDYSQDVNDNFDLSDELVEGQKDIFSHSTSAFENISALEDRQEIVSPHAESLLTDAVDSIASGKRKEGPTDETVPRKQQKMNPSMAENDSDSRED